MNSILISLFILFLLIFHEYTKRFMQLGKWKEGLCAAWFMDTVFTVCGIVIVFCFYHYDFVSFFTLRNILLVLTYLLISLFFLLLAPSGFRLLTVRKQLSEDSLLCAEYRFNESLCMVRNFLLCLLLFLPLFIHLPIQASAYESFVQTWKTSGLSAGFYFTVFLLLFPMTLRQTFYWLKSLTQEPSPLELQLMRRYSLPFRYKERNFFI